MTTHRVIRPAQALTGQADLPADKSIAHRSILFSAISEGTSRIVGFPDAADPQSSLACVRALGIQVDEDDGALIVHGEGLHGLRKPEGDLDCGNSGTTMRLLTGILAGQPFNTRLIGDASLSVRPMRRIMDPLRTMGADVSAEDGHAPLVISGRTSPLSAITYRLPVASAQVKSCVLLAGLYAEGLTSVVETETCRDHTERMLGLHRDVDKGACTISVQGGVGPKASEWHIPGDFSAAAFLLVAASLIGGSRIHLPNVGLNPTRTGLLDILRSMGANIRIENTREISGEPIGDLTVESAELTGVRIDGSIIPNLIDEIPILAVAGACAEGTTTIRDAEELRHKESDRIRAVVTGLRAMGVDVEEFDDGMAIHGGKSLKGAEIATHHDHRIAMAFAIAGLLAEGETRIQDADIADVSFPGFYDTIERLGREASRERL